MILRLWRWLMADDPDHALRQAAARLVFEMSRLTVEQQQDLAVRYGTFWEQANQVAGAVERRPGGIW